MIQIFSIDEALNEEDIAEIPKENDKIYSTTAQNTSNVFNFMILYPTDIIASYSLGMREHVYYTTMYPNAPVSGQKSTCLLAYFLGK